MREQLDMHTHTIASGHAYGTITEMAKEAANRGLQVLGITEHAPGVPGTCDKIYFMNMKVVPRDLFGIRLMLGAEMNIRDYEGTIDLEEPVISNLDLRIAGIHGFCYRTGSTRENTSAYTKAMANPAVDMISHPDDGNCPVEYEALVEASKKYHTLLEVNNNSLRSKSRKNTFENSCRMLEYCLAYDTPIIMSSDAHYMSDVGNFENCRKVIEAVKFPERLIMNYHTASFLDWIQKKRESR